MLDTLGGRRTGGPRIRGTGGGRWASFVLGTLRGQRVGDQRIRGTGWGRWATLVLAKEPYREPPSYTLLEELRNNLTIAFNI